MAQNIDLQKFKGVFTALATPFLNDKVDYASLDRLLERQIAAGVQGFVVNGTTAESPTLTKAEREDLLKHVLKTGRTVVMGCGTNNTATTVEQVKRAEELGAHAVLLVNPYYNKPPQRGMIQHFESAANAIQIPVILYNIPGRTGVSLEVSSIQKLSQHPRIIGVKEATGDIGLARAIRAECGPDFLLISGDDLSYPEFLKASGDGVISVSSHVMPDYMVKLTKAKGDLNSETIRATEDLTKALFWEANPIPVKMSLKLMGVFTTAEVRLPLVPLAETLVPKIKALLERGKYL